MKKGKITSVIVMLMLLTVCLYFISGTYARYASELSANAKVETAVWAVELKDADKQELTDDFELTFEVQNNDNVVPGKIAPSVTATAKLHLDLTGTEVAVDYTAAIDKSDLADIFGASADKVTVKVGSGESATGTVALVDNAAFTAANGMVPIEISITWENDDNLNVSDTTAAGKDLTLPVTLTVQQHLDSDVHTN